MSKTRSPDFECASLKPMTATSALRQSPGIDRLKHRFLLVWMPLNHCVQLCKNARRRGEIHRHAETQKISGRCQSIHVVRAAIVQQKSSRWVRMLLRLLNVWGCWDFVVRPNEEVWSKLITHECRHCVLLLPLELSFWGIVQSPFEIA